MKIVVLKEGNGVGRGGAALGGGGGIFVARDVMSVIVNNCEFKNCTAKGGSSVTGAGFGGASLTLPADTPTETAFQGGFGFGGNPNGTFGGGAALNATTSAIGKDFTNSTSTSGNDGVGGSTVTSQTNGGEYAGGAW